MKMLNTARTILLVLSLTALAAPSQAAPRNSRDNGTPLELFNALQQRCHEMVGKEEREGEGRGHIGQLQVQRFSECMTGRPFM
jgi:hypothetical protein